MKILIDTIFYLYFDSINYYEIMISKILDLITSINLKLQ